MAIAAPMLLDDRPKPVVSGKIAGGNGTRIGFGRCPDENGVAGITRRERLDLLDLRSAWECQWVENPSAIARFIYSQKDERGPIVHDEDCGKDQRRDIEQIPFDSLGLESRAPCRPVVQRNGQLPI